MPAEVYPLVYPFGGLSERFSLTRQPPATSRDELNMRGEDPRDRRLTGAQRAGLSKVPSVALNSAPVRALAAVQQNLVPVDYSIVSNPNNTAEWKVTLPSQMSCYDVKCDSRGNVYALDGNAAWAMYTPDGKRQLSVSVPLQDRAGVLRTIEVSELRQVFVAVAEGGDWKSAIIASWVPGLDVDGALVYDLQWTLRPGRWITHARYFDGRLYTLQDDPELQFSYCVVYDLVETPTPTVLRQFSVPYPSRAIGVDLNGAIFTTHPSFATRGVIPGQTSKNVNVGYDVDDYERNGDIKLWSWFRADRLDAALHLVGETSARRVQVLPDIKPNGIRRHLFGDTSIGPAVQNDLPFYHERGPLAGKPAIFFDGVNNVLTSLSNPGVTEAFADQQLSLLPGYKGAAFAIIAVVTPEPSATMRCLLWQDQENSLAQVNQTAFDRAIVVNRPDGAVPGAATKGHISINEDALAGFGGTAPSDIEGAIFDVKSHSTAGGAGLAPAAGVLTYVCNGGHAIVAGGGAESSLFRWNGCPIDKWNARPIESAVAGKIGICNDQASWGYFRGYLHEIVVLDLRDRANPTTAGLFSDHTTGAAYQYPDTAWSGAADTIMEQLEAVVARRWGIGHLLDDGATYKRGNEGGDPDSNFVHPYGDGATALRKGQVPWNGANGPGAGSIFGDPNKLLSVNAMLAKWDAVRNSLVWVAETNTGGLGYGLVVMPPSIETPDTNPHRIVTAGPPGAGVIDARSFVDLGTSFVVSNAVTFATAYNLADEFPRLSADHFQTIYIPVVSSSTSLGASFVLWRDAAVGVFEVITDASIAASFPAFSLVPAPGAPLYPTAEVSLANRRSEFVYVALRSVAIDGVATTTECLRKIKLVQATHNTDAPRGVVWVGASNGDIKKFVDGGAPTTPTGGAGALASTARMVSSVTAFGRVFFTDGDRYALYDGATDTVSRFDAKKGVIPRGIRLFELWRGRLVGLVGDTQWFMSAKDDPFDWDTAPPEDSPAAAIDGQSADFAGAIPEPINAFVPLTDDLALIGTTSGIHMLVGDPRANGKIDVVSRQHGIAFGRAHTQDTERNVYAMLTTGEVVVFTPAGGMRSISEGKIPARLKQIDFSTHHVRLQWNWEDKGLHVIVIPFGAHVTQLEHYFWEKELDAWHPDKFPLTKQPTCIEVLEGGTLAQRRVVLGCEDGHVRRWDPTANDDDGSAIQSYVTIGPLAPEGEGSLFEFRFSHFDIVLGDDWDGATLELMSANTPKFLSEPQAVARLHAGRNGPVLERVNGAYCYAKLGNGQVGQRWSYNSGSYWATRAGRMRDRSALG